MSDRQMNLQEYIAKCEVEGLRSGFENEGMAPAEIANYVVAAIQAKKLHILPHSEGKEHIRARMEDILEERTPSAGHYTRMVSGARRRSIHLVDALQIVSTKGATLRRPLGARLAL